MKILIDIGHPAHVHYFKNFIYEMKIRNHNFLVIARDKEVTFSLLNSYNIDYKTRGKGSTKILGKILYIFKADYIILKFAKKFKPDIFLSFGSTYAGHTAFLLRRPHIVFDDTEHAHIEHLMYKPFASAILTPNCFMKNMGSKHIKFDSYMDICYLHPKYFKPDSSIFKLLGIKKDDKYVIMRFVSWNASHDLGHSGLSLEMKSKSVELLSKLVKVFISSEGDLPDNLQKYRINLPPDRMHDALYYSLLYFGESGTMASESALLGTPSINISTSATSIGVFADISKKSLMYILPDENKALKKAVEIIKDNFSKEQARNNRIQLLSEKIDLTSFMIWFVENYPESMNVMIENPKFQLKFKEF